MTTITMTTSILEVFAVLVLLALAHTLLVGTSDRPGPADRGFAEDPALAAARAGVVALR
ncbi:hypothetical protein [Blastococcus sp. SYSU D00813]